jgi:hypothetical protein
VEYKEFINSAQCIIPENTQPIIDFWKIAIGMYCNKFKKPRKAFKDYFNENQPLKKFQSA